MARDDTTHWHLYVDESGQFDCTSENVALGAVALSAGNDRYLEVRLRESIRRISPLVPWPFHRWLAKKPSMYGVWRLDSPNVEIPADVDRACKRAAEIWERECPRKLEIVRELTREGNEPEPEQIKYLRFLLRKEDQGGYDTLSAYTMDVCGQIGPLFRDSIAVGDEAQDVPREIFALLVGESDTGDAANTNGKGGRYFHMLVCLLERTVDALERRDGDHVVHIYVAERDEEHPLLGGQPVAFQGAHLRDACSRAMAKTSVCSGPRGVRFSVRGAFAYDAEAPAGIVVADSISNYLWSELLDASRVKVEAQLSRLHEATLEYFNFPMTINGGELSLASASGRARDLVDAARLSPNETEITPDRYLPPEEVDNGWAAVQANEWADHFRNTEVSS